MKIWNVGIVGGGPGGLMTAYFLQKLAGVPVRVTLFEASNRLGGKIFTRRFHTLPARYEAGAAELYDYSLVDEDPLRELIAELGLGTIPMGGFSVIMDDQILSNLDDIRERWGQPACAELMSFDRMARDWMSPREFFDADLTDVPAPVGARDQRFDELLGRIGEPRVRQFIEFLIHSDLATEPELTSLSYGLQNYLMNDPAYMRLYSIEGGNERLPIELARRIDAEVRLEHSVTAIGRARSGRMRVTSTHQEQVRENDFDFVVVALPLRDLPRIAFHGPGLEDAVRRHQRHYDFPAHYLRITILFDQPFWRHKLQDSYFMLDQFDGCCLYDESAREPQARHGVLGWLLGGQAAVRMSQLSDEQLIAHALDSLPAFLREGRNHFVEGQVHRWIGAVNGMPGGVRRAPVDRRHQPDPVEHPELFVVGDYLFDSTINGVLDSADHVAHWLADLMSHQDGNQR